MIVTYGRYTKTSSDGTEVHVDLDLSQQQTDLLVGVITHHGYTPNDVRWVDMTGESVRIGTIDDWKDELRARGEIS